MAYGIWLYKEITTSNGVIRLEIKKKNYTGESIEIEVLLKDGLTLQVDGRDITDPIIGTTLSISLIDTGQIDTSQFFTPDATLYQVVLYRDSVRIWIGYLTPDSYSENLVYSDVINLTARDNLGRLNDFIYDKSEGLQAVYQFIESLCERVSISMPLVFYSGITAKRIAESEVDTSLRGVAASVDTLRFVGMNYREIVEMILKGIGCQMRYSYNTDRGYFLGVYDISQLYSELSTQEAFFVEKSGYKEIKPAWREVLIEQDYGLSSNLFDGYFSKDELAGAETFLPEDIDNNRWGGDGSMLFCNQYLAKVDDFQSTSLFIAADRSDSYCFYRKNVFKSDNVLTLKMQLNNTLRMMPSYVSDYDTIGNLYVGYHIESDPDLQPVQYFETYTLKYKFNVYLVGRDTGITYVMRDKWIPLSEDDAEPITFEMAQVWYNDPSLWDRIEQVEIVVNSTPEDGELRLVVYAAEGAAIAPLSTIHQTTFAKISNIEIAYQNDIQGASSRIEVNAAHNLKSNINLEIGQVPNNKGNNLAYWGGLFDSAGYPLNSWVLNDGDIVRYNLMELVARQHIHQNSKNYALLSGVMMSDSALSLTHNITYKGKVYSILSASHNLINGKMNVTSMQEIEAYQVAELTVIDSPLESSSGTRLGSGDNEVIQFSNDAGNAKRIYELDLATDEDKEESYVIIDKGSLDSARRIPLTDVGGLFNKAFKLHYNEDGVLVSVEVLANLWTNFGISAGGEGTGSGGGTGGATSLEGLKDVSLSALVDGQSLVWSNTLNKWINKTIEPGLDEDALSDYLVENDYAVKSDIPSSLKSPYKLLFGDKSYDGSAEVTITAADLGALTEHQDISHLLSKDAAAATYQVKGNYLTSITSKMVTDALTYTPLANTTKYALSDSVGGTALDSAKLGGQLPTYYATATSVTKVADDLSTFKTLFDSMFEKKDGKIHAKLTLWTDYALVAGGEGDGTGGGGGGLTAFSVIINNKTYNSDNGVATITEQLQPLITASNKLDYSLISGTPTSLPASDVYDWAKAATKPTYTKSEVGLGNVTNLAASDYLTALSSNATNAVSITVGGTTKSITAATLKTSLGLGSLAYKSSLVASDIPSLSWNKITSDKPTTLSGYGITDALSKNGGTIDGTLRISNAGWGSQLSIINTNANQDILIRYYTQDTNNFIGAIGFNTNLEPIVNIIGVGTKALIHSGNYSDYALPLSGGTITGATLFNAYKSPTQQPSLGNKADGTHTIIGNESFGLQIWSNNVGNTNMQVHRFDGTATAYNMIIQPLGGNVLIGTTTNISNGRAKLQVKGHSEIDGTLYFTNASSRLLLFTTNGSYNADIIYSGNQLQIHNVSFLGTYGDTNSIDFGYGGGQVSYTPTVWMSMSKGALELGKTGATIGTTTYPRFGRFDRGEGGLILQLGKTNVFEVIDKDWTKVCFGVGDTGVYINGNVGIGIANPTSKLQVVGNISTSGAITAGTASDIRLKDNIQTIDQNKAIEVLMALNPITYHWNDKAKELGGYEGVSQGFVAQEYESVIPNSGRAIWGEYRAIDYTKAIPFMVSVEQNHEKRIRQLEEELKRLRREYYGIQ